MTTLLGGVIVLGVVVVGLVAAFFRLRRWATDVEHSPDSATERAHRLRQSQTAWTLSVIGLGFVLFAVAQAEQGPTGPGHHASTAQAGWGFVMLAGAVCYLAGLLLIRAAIRPSIVRVREIDKKIPYRLRQVSVALLMGAIVGITYGIAVAHAPAHGPARVFTIAAVYVIVVLASNALLAPLWPVALKAHDLDPATHRRLMALSDRLHGRIRDIKAFPGRSQRVANALQVGMIPGLRYVLITDYLLDNMTDDEVDAVVAHEIGHARGNHIIKKLLGILVVWGLLLWATGTAAGGSHNSQPGLLVAMIPIGFIVALIVVQGVLGIRLEQKADDAAARDVGSEHLASALGKLSDLNHTRLRTGKAWNLLTQHPGLEQRIQRLRRPSPRGSVSGWSTVRQQEHVER
jgi:Zn-dependent protease with chaperone function